MKTFLLLLCTLSVAVNLFSQKDSSLFRNQIKISPLRIIDFVHPGYEISYERLHGKKYSTQLSLAYITNTVWDIDFENLKGYRAAIEEKYFLKQVRKHRSYVSAEASWCHMNFDKEVSGLKQNDSTGFAEFDQIISFRKNILILNVKYGIQTCLSPHLIFDVSAGLGARYLDIKQTTFPQESVYEPVAKNFFPDIYDHASKSGRRLALNVPVSLKLGYQF